MDSRLFDEDPITGVRRLFHFDNVTEEVTIETQHDVEPILEFAKRNFNDRDNGWKGDLHHVASIPLPLYFDLKREGKVDDEQYMKRWLNDPDNRLFRTKPGTV